MISALFHGYLLSLSLILAIGAQNAFVLRQGLLREHIGWVVLVCATSDAILIAIGVAGFGAISTTLPLLGEMMRWGGALFLFVYGALRFRAAFQGGAALRPQDTTKASLGRVLMTCLILTWANPHVYLDTVVLLGSIAAQYAPYGLFFGIGAAVGSFSFFAVLGYGARLLGPIFAKPRAWVYLEVIVGLTMWMIATTLVISG